MVDLRHFFFVLFQTFFVRFARVLLRASFDI